MHRQTIEVVELLAYIFFGFVIMKRLRSPWRETSFALLNVMALFLVVFHKEDGPGTAPFLAYIGLVVFQYLTLRLFVKKKGWWPWLAFFVPLLALVMIRYIPASSPIYARTLLRYGPFFLGLSYLAFRTSLLVLEIRNGVVAIPGFFDYLGFCFFVPIMSVGPINSYSNHYRAFTDDPPSIPFARAALRILVGIVKYKFIGVICYQLSYANLLFDDHYHPWIDLPVAVLFYYLYLYCNFSGFCDMAIGAAGVMGIAVLENFNNPFAARNLKDFWNRWHITLSQYMRDVVFTPLSKYLVSITGPKFVNHAVAMTIVVVFLLVGIWHGVGWNYAAFGAAHALGLVIHHYYAIWLKKRLGRDGFKAYNSNRWIQAAAVFITFCYCAACLFLFANTFPEMRHIFSVMK